MVRRADDAPRHTLKRFKPITTPTVADVPGRCEPGTGEIHFPAVPAALDRLRYDGVVALEGWASGDAVDALDRFRGGVHRGGLTRRSRAMTWPVAALSRAALSTSRVATASHGSTGDGASPRTAPAKPV